MTPKELCDKYHVLHRATYEWFEIGYAYRLGLGWMILRGLPASITLAAPLPSSIPSMFMFSFGLLDALISSSRICQEVYLNLDKNDLLESKNDNQVYCEGCSKSVVCLAHTPV